MSTGRSRLTRRVTRMAEMVGEKAQVSHGDKFAIVVVASGLMCSRKS